MLKNWNNVTFDERNELVFLGRNKDYGAYELRTAYNRRVTFIIGGMMAFAVLLFGVKTLFDTPEELLVRDVTITTQVEITPRLPAEELPPSPPPASAPPPMDKMMKFVPPVIRDNAKEEEPQKTQDQALQTNVGTENQESDLDIVAPPAEVGPGESDSEILVVVEEMPEPPGGLYAFRKYLAQNIQYPEMARVAGISGKVYLRFVVEVDGSISEVQILSGVPGCSECDNEAVQALRKYPEKWKPGKNNGRPARVYYTLPISFNIPH